LLRRDRCRRWISRWLYAKKVVRWTPIFGYLLQQRIAWILR